MKGRFQKMIETGIYRSRQGIFLGVMKGLADYFDFSVFWLRLLVVLLMFFSGFWPVILIYCIAALLMKPEPVTPLCNEDEREFYDSYVASRKGAAHRVKRRFDNLERRIRRMEDMVTSKEFDWDRRMHDL